MLARYQPDAVLPVLEAALAAGQTALQAIFQGLAARPLDAVSVDVPPAAGPRELRLAPDDELALRDWDTPGDMSRPAPTS